MMDYIISTCKIGDYFRSFFCTEDRTERLCECVGGHKTADEALWCHVAVKNGIHLVVNYM